VLLKQPATLDYEKERVKFISPTEFISPTGKARSAPSAKEVFEALAASLSLDGAVAGVSATRFQIAAHQPAASSIDCHPHQRLPLF